jgi:hypothetical protein
MSRTAKKTVIPFGRMLRSFWTWQRETASGEIEGQLSHFLLGFLQFGRMAGISPSATANVNA